MQPSFGPSELLPAPFGTTIPQDWRAPSLPEGVTRGGRVLVAAPADHSAVLQRPVLDADVLRRLARGLHLEAVLEQVEDVVAGCDELALFERLERPCLAPRCGERRDTLLAAADAVGRDVAAGDAL